MRWYFVAYVFVQGILLLNLFAGVLCDAFASVDDCRAAASARAGRITQHVMINLLEGRDEPKLKVWVDATSHRLFVVSAKSYDALARALTLTEGDGNDGDSDDKGSGNAKGTSISQLRREAIAAAVDWSTTAEGNGADDRAAEEDGGDEDEIPSQQQQAYTAYKKFVARVEAADFGVRALAEAQGMPLSSNVELLPEIPPSLAAALEGRAPESEEEGEEQKEGGDEMMMSSEDAGEAEEAFLGRVRDAIAAAFPCDAAQCLTHRHRTGLRVGRAPPRCDTKHRPGAERAPHLCRWPACCHLAPPVGESTSPLAPWQRRVAVIFSLRTREATFGASTCVQRSCLLPVLVEPRCAGVRRYVHMQSGAPRVLGAGPLNGAPWWCSGRRGGRGSRGAMQAFLWKGAAQTATSRSSMADGPTWRTGMLFAGAGMRRRCSGLSQAVLPRLLPLPGSCWPYRDGNLALLATSVADRMVPEGQDFLPLSIDFVYRNAASGRIPQGIRRKCVAPVDGTCPSPALSRGIPRC